MHYAEEEEKKKSAQSKVVTAPAVYGAHVRHVHAHKTYCEGTLSISGHQMKFRGESASAGQPDKITVACSDIREIKKNTHVLSHEYKDDFHVRTRSGETFNFAPADASTFDFAALASACSK